MTRYGKPPPLTRWLLGLIVPSGVRGESVLGDLEEEYGSRLERDGAFRARWWYRRQAWCVIVLYGQPRAGSGRWRGGAAGWLAEVGEDARYGLRCLRSQPGFTTVAVATLALGIGANTAVFSVVQAVLLEPLPYPEAHELVTIHNRFGNRNLSVHPWTPDAVLREMMASGRFEAVAGYAPQSFAVTDGDHPYTLEGALVTPGFFRVFEADMVIGRSFVEADGEPDAPRTAILSHEVWQERFGGSPDVIGRTIRAETMQWPSDDAEVRQIVGVLEPGFRLYGPRVTDPALWIPYQVETPMKISVARLRGGSTLQEAQSDLDVLNTRIRERRGDSRFDLAWTSLKDEVVGGDRITLLVLQGAVGVVLLIACVNLANLLLARQGRRRSELAVRTAMGASRGRLFRQTVTEGVVLSLLGSLAAVLVLIGGLAVFREMAPRGIPRLDGVSVDRMVLLSTLVTAVGVGMAVGTVAALASVWRPPGELLGTGGRGTGHGSAPLPIGRALVVAEVGLVFVLLVGAGILLRSFLSVTSVDPGFRTRNVAAVPLDLPRNRYRSLLELEGFYQGVLERARGVPGVESATLSLRMPLDRGIITEYRLEGALEDEAANVQYELVAPGYFQALDIPLVAGRTLEVTDRSEAPPVAVVDEAMARVAWPGRSAVGQRLRLFGLEEWLTVVGVVGSVRGSGLSHEPRPGIYLPLSQGLEVGDTRAVLLAGTRGGPAEVAGGLREAIWDVDPRQPVPEVTTLERVVSSSVGPYRFRAVLFGAFGIVALVLATAGVYGVVAQLALMRRHELGVRVALGARAGEVVRLVVGQGAKLAVIGVGVGLVVILTLRGVLAETLSGPSVAVSPFMPQPSAMLHGPGPDDLSTLVTAVIVTSGMAVLATLVPAWRAATADPVETLGAE